jgi:hypothetical protein
MIDKSLLRNETKGLLAFPWNPYKTKFQTSDMEANRKQNKSLQKAPGFILFSVCKYRLDKGE